MKSLMIAALVTAQLTAAQSAYAASIDDQGMQSRVQMGAFAGARLRLQLGGAKPKASAGLTLASMGRSQAQDGRVAHRFGEGVAFGMADGRPPGLSVAGQPLKPAKMALRDKDEAEDEDDGLSPLAIGGIVVGGLALAAVVGYAILISSVESE
jgi:hypothetical protein